MYLPPALLLATTAGALALELTFTWGLWSHGGTEDAIELLAAHGIASALLARALIAILDERVAATALAWSFLVCLLLPALNVFILLPAALVLRLAPATAQDGSEARFAVLRPAVPSAGFARVPKQAASALYDEAGLVSVLKWSRDPERRCDAVLSSMRLTDHERIRLLQLALRDPEDEVRLLAYGLLEQKTQSMTGRMREHQLRLDAAETPAEAAALHRALAFDAWQLVDLALVQGEVARHYLRSSKGHLSEAIERLPESPGLHFLRGKVLLALGDPGGAQTAFQTAQRCGLVPTSADQLIMERAAARLTDPVRPSSQPGPAEPRPGTRTKLQYAS